MSLHTPKYFFAHIKRKETIRGTSLELPDYLQWQDHTFTRWQSLETKFLREVFLEATGMDLAFISLVESFVNFPRTDVKQLGKEETECRICLEGFSDVGQAAAFIPASAERPMKLDCGHVFGERCLATWLWKFRDLSHACPLCRRDIWAPLPSSLRALGLDTPHLLSSVGDNKELNFADAFGSINRIWFRVIRTLKHIEYASGMFKSKIDSLPMRARDALQRHMKDAMVACCGHSTRDSGEHWTWRAPIAYGRRSCSTNMESSEWAKTDASVFLSRQMRILWCSRALPKQNLENANYWKGYQPQSEDTGATIIAEPEIALGTAEILADDSGFELHSEAAVEHRPGTGFGGAQDVPNSGLSSMHPENLASQLLEDIHATIADIGNVRRLHARFRSNLQILLDHEQESQADQALVEQEIEEEEEIDSAPGSPDSIS